MIKSNHRSVTTIIPSAAAFPHRKPGVHWSSRSIDYQFLNEKKVNRFEQRIQLTDKKKQLRSTQIGRVRLIIFRFISLPMSFFLVAFISHSLITNFRTSRVKTHSNLGDEYIESFDRKMTAV